MGCTKVLAAFLAVAIATVGASAPATSCVNITLTNILGIGECIGGSTDFCSSSNASSTAQGVMKITRCAIQGIFSNGSPQGIISTLLPLLLIPASRGIPNLSSGLNIPFLGGSSLGGSGLGGLINAGGLGTGGLNMASLIRNDSCNGSITISLSAVGNLSSCTGDILMMCTAGSPTTTSMIQSDFQAIACLLRQLPTSQFTTAFQGIACPLLQAVSTAARGNLGLQVVLIGIRSSLQSGLGVQCSSLPSLPTIG